MQNRKSTNSTFKKYYKTKSFKQKLFLSNDLKKTLLISFQEAKSFKTFISPELLLYGLLTQSNGFASRLLCKTISNFRKSKISAKNICTKIRDFNKEKYQTTFNKPLLSEFTEQLREENEKTPWFGPEAKIVLKISILSSLRSKNKIKVISTKHLFFELLNNENIRTLLRQLSS